MCYLGQLQRCLHLQLKPFIVCLNAITPVDYLLTSCYHHRRSGVYQWRNLVNNKVYVGSAVNLSRRRNGHLYNLSVSKHNSVHFQRAWYKYGKPMFVYEIIEFVDDKTTLLAREQYWMDETKCYDRDYGYNICVMAGSHLGMKRSQEVKDKLKGRRNTPEQNAKISLGLRNNEAHVARSRIWGLSNKGVALSEERKRNQRAGISKYRQDVGNDPDMTGFVAEWYEKISQTKLERAKAKRDELRAAGQYVRDEVLEEERLKIKAYNLHQRNKRNGIVAVELPVMPREPKILSEEQLKKKTDKLRWRATAKAKKEALVNEGLPHILLALEKESLRVKTRASKNYFARKTRKQAEVMARIQAALTLSADTV